MAVAGKTRRQICDQLGLSYTQLDTIHRDYGVDFVHEPGGERYQHFKENMERMGLKASNRGGYPEDFKVRVMAEVLAGHSLVSIYQTYGIKPRTLYLWRQRTDTMLAAGFLAPQIIAKDREERIQEYNERQRQRMIHEEAERAKVEARDAHNAPLWEKLQARTRAIVQDYIRLGSYEAVGKLYQVSRERIRQIIIPAVLEHGIELPRPIKIAEGWKTRAEHKTERQKALKAVLDPGLLAANKGSILEIKVTNGVLTNAQRKALEAEYPYLRIKRRNNKRQALTAEERERRRQHGRDSMRALQAVRAAQREGEST